MLLPPRARPRGLLGGSRSAGNTLGACRGRALRRSAVHAASSRLPRKRLTRNRVARFALERFGHGARYRGRRFGLRWGPDPPHRRIPRSFLFARWFGRALAAAGRRRRGAPRTVRWRSPVWSSARRARPDEFCRSRRGRTRPPGSRPICLRACPGALCSMVRFSGIPFSIDCQPQRQPADADPFGVRIRRQSSAMRER